MRKNIFILTVTDGWNKHWSLAIYGKPVTNMNFKKSLQCYFLPVSLLNHFTSARPYFYLIELNLKHVTFNTKLFPPTLLKKVPHSIIH